MSKIIIGIHGLGNKPPKAILTDWWARSIVPIKNLIRIKNSFISHESEESFKTNTQLKVVTIWKETLVPTGES